MEIQTQYPLITIGIPTYNRGKSIYRTLDSIWMQRYPNLEVVISDNCSTDDTYEVVDEVKQDHPEVNYYRQEKNIGMMANFEFVLKKATGKYFMWVSDDDILEDGALLVYASYLEQHPGYSLVSGQIQYWLEDKEDLSERGFTFEQKSASLRVLGYYAKVVYGGMIHGLMRRDLAMDIPIRSIIGNDFHFIASLAYLGEIKQLEDVGYHKSFGGTSKTFKQYARHMGDSRFAGYFPHIKIAYDAFAEIMFRSNVYSAIPIHSRFTLAISSLASMLLRHYGTIYPFMVGGKIKRFVTRSSRLQQERIRKTTALEQMVSDKSKMFVARGSWIKDNSSRLTG